MTPPWTLDDILFDDPRLGYTGGGLLMRVRCLHCEAKARRTGGSSSGSAALRTSEYELREWVVEHSMRVHPGEV